MNANKAMGKRSGLSAMVLKAMGLFGGLQVFGIISSIVRTKLIALWIGPAGVGLFGLYNAALDMISSVTQLNMRSSAVRDIAQCGEERGAIDMIAGVVRRWAVLLGLLGSLVILAGAPLLSRWTFGDNSHAVAFIWLSIVMLLYSLTGGESAILQGTRRLKQLAASSIWGTVAGTLISIPLYYFYHLQSIVPSIIVFALANFIAVFCVRYKPTSRVKLPVSTVMEKGRGLIVLGAFLTVSAFVTQLSSYIFMTYVNHVGGEDAVGYYQAGFTLVNKYLGLVFTAIAMEYFPRLSAVSSSNRRMGIFANHETGIVLVAMLPAVILFIALRQLIVMVFFSAEFAVIYDYISWGAAGSVFRGISWCLAYVILARGDGKLYLLTEISSSVFYLLFNFILYTQHGVDGLGYAYFLWYFTYTVVVLLVCWKRYGIVLSRQVTGLACLAVGLSVVASLLINHNFWLVLVLGIVTAFFSLAKIKKLLAR